MFNTSWAVAWKQLAISILILSVNISSSYRLWIFTFCDYLQTECNLLLDGYSVEQLPNCSFQNVCSICIREFLHCCILKSMWNIRMMNYVLGIPSTVHQMHLVKFPNFQRAQSKEEFESQSLKLTVVLYLSILKLTDYLWLCFVQVLGCFFNIIHFMCTDLWSAMSEGSK